MVQPWPVSTLDSQPLRLPGGLADVVCALLASGPVTRAPVDPAWPLHRALLELRERAVAAGSADPLSGVATRPDPHVGVRVVGAEQAMRSLRSQGLVVAAGSGVSAGWELTAEAATIAKYGFLRSCPADPELLLWAAQRWKASLSAVEKARSKASRLSGLATVSGARRRQLTPARLR